MAILPIRLIGDPVLRTVCRHIGLDELRSDKIQRFIDDLIETMRDANGAGLAAPQVGHPLAIAAVLVSDNPRYPYKPNFPLTVVVNPTLTAIGEASEKLYEGCLSIPNLRGLVSRAMHVQVDALDRHGNPITFDVHGLSAGTFQHEFDHLEGRLFVDRVEDPDTFCTWDNFDRYYKDDFVKRAESIVQQYGG